MRIIKNVRFKFITINIWFGGIVWENLVSFIKNEDPDILALQEVYDSHNPEYEKRFRTMDELRIELTNLPYNVFEPTIFETSHDRAPWGNAIFSKFPINQHKNVLFDLPVGEYNFETGTNPRLAPEGMLMTEIKTSNDQSITVCSWHGVWDNHGGNSEVRDIMGHSIITALIGKSPVILAGDTNLGNNTRVVRSLENELKLQSVFGDTLQSTFNMTRKKEEFYAFESVDKVFISSELTVVEKEMPIVDISDHYPLEVVLELK